MKQPYPWHQAVLVLVCLMSAGIVHAAKTDIVRLVNGDEITGELKSLDFGVLMYSTDSMGTVKIDWEDVAAITSQSELCRWKSLTAVATSASSFRTAQTGR